MRIKRLAATNWKGRSFMHALNPVAVFVAPNDSGKTARLDAARTVLNGGFHPDMRKAGKGLGETANLLCGAEAALRADLSLPDDAVNVIQLNATYRRDKSGWKLEGASPVESIKLMMPAAQFFALSGPEQSKHIFGLLKSDRPLSDITDVITNQKEKVEPRTEGTDEAIDEMLDTVMTMSSTGADGELFNAFLLRVLEKVKTQKLDCESSSRRYAGHASASVEVSTSEQSDPRQRKAAAEKTISMLTGELEALMQQRGAVSIPVNPKDAEDAEEWLMNTPLPVAEANVEDLKAQKERLEKAIADYKELKLVDTSPIVMKKATANAEWRDANLRIADLEQKIADLGTTDCCVTCRSKRKGWKAEAEDYYRSLIAKAQQDAEQAKRGVAIAESELKGANEHNATCEQARQAHTANHGALAAAMRKLAEAVTTLTVAKAMNELVTKASGANPEDAAKLKSLDELIAMTRTNISQLEEQVGACNREIGQLEAEAKIQSERAKNDEKLAATKQVIEALTKLRDDEVERAFGNILTTVNKVTGGIIPEPISVRDGEFGRWRTVGRAKEWVAHVAFGGTFQAVFYTALAVAIAAQNTFKLVIIDELGFADAQNKLKLMERLKALCAEGTIDQFLGADVTDAGLPQDVVVRFATV